MDVTSRLFAWLSSQCVCCAVGAIGARPTALGTVGLEHLTTRQIEVLQLVARGMTEQEIAETLFLSRRTVHAHLRFTNSASGNRGAATRYAVQHGLL